MKRKALLGIFAIVTALLAACQPGGLIQTAHIDTVQVQGIGGSLQVRQGQGLVTLEVTGELLSDIALAKLGSLVGTVMTNNDLTATIDFDIPHATDLGWQPLTLNASSGVVTMSDTVEVTGITSGPIGDDGTGLGTRDDPFRSLTHALSIAQAGDTVQLLDGTYNVAGGEVWPQMIPADVTVRGESRAGTILDGELAGANGVALNLNATLTDLSLTGFMTATGGSQPGAVIHNVRGFLNTNYGLVIGGAADYQVSDSRFDQNQTGVRVWVNAGLTMSGSSIDNNAGAGIDVANNAHLSDSGSSFADNLVGLYVRQNASAELIGSQVTGSAWYGLWSRDSAAVTITDSAFEQNLYGVLTHNSSELTMVGGSASHNIRDGFFFAHTSSVDLDGVEIHDNDDDKMGGTCFSGIAAFTTGEIVVRDTSFEDNCFGLYIAVEASLFDLGTAVDPGGNSFANSTNYHLFDNRPALGAPVGVVITAIGTSFSSIEPTGGVKTGVDWQIVGPNLLWQIHNANQRIEFQP